MAYTVLKLITNAYYESGVVSRGFETVTGQQTTDGLDYLNDLLGEKTVEQGLIPYYEKYSFPAIIDEERYFIPDLINIDTFVFFIDSVRYATVPTARREYFGTSRADNIQSLPGRWHLEREFGGASIYIYFKPDQNYPLEVWGQFRLNEVTINQDLSLTLDRFYITFLKFELAERICAEMNFSVPPKVEMTLKKLRDNISKKSAPMDLQLMKLSSLQRRGGLNYGTVNIGKGWVS